MCKGEFLKILLFILLLSTAAFGQNAAETRGRQCLPEHLRVARHTDWIWPLSYVPRSWTAYCGEGPAKNHGWKEDIPVPGTKTWHWKDKNGKWRPYFAKTWKMRKDGRAWHFRVGFRWDKVDGYYNLVFPFTMKRMKFDLPPDFEVPK